ncbi:MAG: tRNA (N(6)-L-threonylcarbamoyladenosine(37)-C(2))-methylthiotransferase MtaB [Blautia sp.]|nr:tRNA (N(6)-L-threonylcarbamoyladenosine(37)-C(2))-methylthiotransferase MtaB [Blautia sp.]
MKNVALHNLGCKVNAYEIDVMQQILQEKGYHIVPFDQPADIYIVNTCTVTNIADRKSRQMLHRAKQLNPAAIVVAVGCYVQTGREAVEKDDSIDLAIGNNRKKDIAAILEEFLEGRGDAACRQAFPVQTTPDIRHAEHVDAARGQASAPGILQRDKTLYGATILDINRTDEYEEVTLKQTAEHTRAYIKIQDGCNQFCSYCAIPYARGRVRSRKPEDVMNEIRGLVEAGYKEVVLTGIHISSYGIDFQGKKAYSGESGLIGLVEQIHTIEGLERIRLGSLEPRIVTEETARRLGGLPKLCPHFHLSLQSGSDTVLKRMNRRYTTGEYYTGVERLRKYFPHPAITTDIIVGFPGETEEEFEETKRFLEKVGFYEMHVFKYSRREGTAAASMPGQVPEQVRTRRSNELLAMEKRQSAEFRRYYIGSEAEVLLEEEKEIGGTTWLIGHTRDYVRAAVPKTPELHANDTVKVRFRKQLTEEILV